MGHYDTTARSGIFRVVENLAKEMINIPECSLSFCSFHQINTVIEAVDYYKSMPDFANTPFLKPTSSFFKKKKHQHRMSRLATALQSAENISVTSKLILKAKYQKERVFQKLYATGNRKYLPLAELDEADIYHTPFFPISNEVKNSGVKSRFITCYDLIPIYKPEFCHQGVIDRMQEFLNTITPETWIFCISQSARSELITYMGNRVDPRKAIVTELAASQQFYKSMDVEANARARTRYGIPDGPFVLSLCTLEPRKNIERAVSAFAQMVQQQHLNDLSLVLVGNKGFKSQQLIDGIECSAEIKKRIIITGFVADEYLAALYTQAVMFVYPSLYEGFGLPPLEAMQCGTPVITSNVTSLPEVVGDAGIMIDPMDKDALCQAMWDVYSQPTLRQQLSEKSLNRAKQFSWKRCAQETVTAYKTSLQS